MLEADLCEVDDFSMGGLIALLLVSSVVLNLLVFFLFYSFWIIYELQYHHTREEYP